jgi:phosphate transport system protein
MPRDSFQQELDNLVAGMLDLGRQVEASLENMVRAMEERDAKLAGKELGVDARYKARSPIPTATCGRSAALTAS